MRNSPLVGVNRGLLMSIYEITFIIREDKSEEVEGLIKKLSGKILNKKSLGRKKFTYLIKKDTAGFYLVIIFELEPSKINEFDKELRINQNIIRHLIISYQKEFSPREIQEKLDELNNVKPKLAEEKIQKVEQKDKKEQPQEKEVIKKPEGVVTRMDVKKKIDQKEDKIVKEEKVKIEEVLKKPKIEIPKVEIPKPQKEAFSEEERLAKLEEKLDELLKD